MDARQQVAPLLYGRERLVWVDQVSLTLVLATFCAGIFLTEHIRIPWPLLFALPILRYLSHRQSFAYSVEALASPWSSCVFVIPLLYGYASSNMSRIAYVISAGFYLVIFAALFFQNPAIVKNIVIILTVFLGVSSLVFLLQVHDLQGAINVYDFIFGKRAGAQPTGLASSLHLFGYHLAALIPLAMSFCLSTTSVSKRLFWISLLVIGVWSLFLAAERAALLSAGLGVLFIFLFGIRQKRISLAVAVFILIALLTNVPSFEIGELPLIKRIEGESDTAWRLSLQIRALKAIFRYPFGLMISNVQWNQIASDLFLDDVEITAHNSYLVNTLYLGVWALFWMLLLLTISVYVFIRDVVTEHAQAGKNFLLMRTGLVGAFIALLVNGMFHNSSLFTLDGVTWTVYIVLWLWHKDFCRPLDRPKDIANKVG